jgi:hypothetical protein
MKFTDKNFFINIKKKKKKVKNYNFLKIYIIQDILHLI